MPRENHLVYEIAQELYEREGIEGSAGRNLAQDILAIVARHAAAAYSRSGTELVAEPDDTMSELLADVLNETADKAAGTLLQWHDAMRMGRDDQLDFPNAAIADLLATVAALRAALGYTPTTTAPEILAARRDTDAVTHAGDETRLHLAAEHGLLFTLAASDRLATAEHLRRHAATPDPPPGHVGGHTVDDLSWTDRRIQNEITAAAADGYPRHQFDRYYAQHQARYLAAANGGHDGH